jgi:transcriptional regulator with XRE-family HTH domain
MARKAFGEVPQYEIARRLNVSEPHLSQLINGKREPSIDFVCETIRLLGGEFEHYFRDTGIRRPRYRRRLMSKRARSVRSKRAA